MPWAFKDLKADLARLLNQDLGDLYGKAAELEVRKVIDQTDVQHDKSDKFHWELWLMAGSGFFTAGFSLYVTNAFTQVLQLPIIEPFFGPAPASSPVINTLAVFGMMIGHVVFGILSDVKGRTFAYGVELLMMIFGTIGMATSSVTFTPFWRLILGVGIGADYSLSALIVAEWSSTRWRPFSMAAVLLMNLLGQAVASLTAFAISQAFFPGAVDLNVIINPLFDGRLDLDDVDLKDAVSARDFTNTLDKAWRVAVLLSIVFALMAIVFRPLVPETPLWAATHRNFDMNRLGRAVFSSAPARSDAEHPDDNTYEDITRIQRVKTFLKGLRVHLFDPHRLWAFVGISAAWFTNEFIWMGMGLSVSDPVYVQQQSPLNKTRVIEVIQPKIDQLDLIQVVNDVVYDLMYKIPLSIIGGLLASALVDRVYRVRWMGWCFMAYSAWNLGMLVVVLVGNTRQESESSMFVALIEVMGEPPLAFFSNIGPTMVLFILGVELFRTEYRGTLYGFAAAFGKLGNLVSQPVATATDDVSFIFWSVTSTAALIAALVTWAWIPETQVLEPRKRWLAVVPNRTLEDIAQDPCKDQQLGISQVWQRAFRLIPARIRQTGDQDIEEGPRDEDKNHGDSDATSNGPGAEQVLEVSELVDGHQVPGGRLRNRGDGSFGHHQDQDRPRNTDNELPEVFELAFVPASIEHTQI